MNEAGTWRKESRNKYSFGSIDPSLQGDFLNVQLSCGGKKHPRVFTLIDAYGVFAKYFPKDREIVSFVDRQSVLAVLRQLDALPFTGLPDAMQDALDCIKTALRNGDYSRRSSCEDTFFQQRDLELEMQDRIKSRTRRLFGRGMSDGLATAAFADESGEDRENYTLSNQ